jgi:K+-transporting ATPase KdpF subunit
VSGLYDYLTAHPGLLLFTLVSAAIVVYLLYAMINPSRF